MMKNLELAKLLICFSIATYATVDFAADSLVDDESIETSSVVKKNRKSRSNRNRKQIMQSESQQSEMVDKNGNPISNKKGGKNNNGKVQEDEAMSQKTEQAIQTLQRSLENLDEEKRQTVIEKIEKASKVDITADKAAYVDALNAVYDNLGGQALEVFIAGITTDNETAKKDLNNLVVSLKSKNKKVWNIVKKHVNRNKNGANEQGANN